MADDRAGFRAVLHEWACQHLEKCGHVGPFEILGVDVDHVRGNGSPVTPADDEVWVRIRFRHGGGCPDWSRPDWLCRPETSWCMPDTTTTVAMLNELLTLADKS